MFDRVPLKLEIRVQSAFCSTLRSFLDVSKVCYLLFAWLERFSIDFDSRMRFVLALGLLYSMLCKLINKTHAILNYYIVPLEQFSIECRKAITLVNPN